jgi:hypothetical protein
MRDELQVMPSALGSGLYAAIAACFLFGALLAVAQDTSSNTTEGAALLEFKAQLTRKEALDRWSVPSTMCSWEGVICNANGQAVEL